jgi:hypothetical protein
MRLFIAVFTLCLSLNHANAQFYYSFSQYQTAYQEITDGVAATTDTWDDPSFSVPLGFTFSYFGLPYTEVYASEEVGLGGMVGFTAPGVKVPLIIVDGSDLMDRGNKIGQHLSPITYKIFGPPGNQVCVIQWKNAGYYGDIDDDAISTDFTNFQLWLHEATSVIEIKYGPNSITQPSISLMGAGPSIGLMAWINLDSGTFSPNSRLLVGPLSTPNFAPFDFALPGINGIPTDGTVFKFDKSLSTASAPLQDAGLRVVPNPVTERFSLLAVDGNQQALRIQISDALGRTVLETTNPNQISVSHLPKGPYLMQVRVNGSVYTDKLVKM